MERVSAGFGVPLAPDKTEGLVMEIMFLGIVIDSERMECSLLDEKVHDLHMGVHRVMGQKKVILQD